MRHSGSPESIQLALSRAQADSLQLQRPNVVSCGKWMGVWVGVMWASWFLVGRVAVPRDFGAAAPLGLLAVS